MQCWGLLEANEQKWMIQHGTGGVGPYVNIPMQSVPTVLTMIAGSFIVMNLIISYLDNSEYLNFMQSNMAITRVMY